MGKVFGFSMDALIFWFILNGGCTTSGRGIGCGFVSERGVGFVWGVDMQGFVIFGSGHVEEKWLWF